VITADVIVVGQDDDVSPLEEPIQAPRPLACTPRVARRYEVEIGEPVDVLLALGDKDRDFWWRGEQLGQPVRQPRNAIQVVDEAAGAIRAPLPKFLRFGADYLIAQRPGPVPIVVNAFYRILLHAVPVRRGP
jgi:hypothetical protein